MTLDNGCQCESNKTFCDCCGSGGCDFCLPVSECHVCGKLICAKCEQEDGVCTNCAPK